MKANRQQFGLQISIILFFTWILSLLYQGPILIGILQLRNLDLSLALLLSTLCHALGYFVAPYFLSRQTIQPIKILFLGSLCFATSAGFLFADKILFFILLSISSFCAGINIVSYASLLHHYIGVQERHLVVARILIYGSLLLIIIHLITTFVSVHISYLFSVSCLLGAIITHYQLMLRSPDDDIAVGTGRLSSYTSFLAFIFILSIDSGIMFHVIYPFFGNLSPISAIYSNVPYLITIFLLLKFIKNKAYRLIYVGFILWGITFINFSFSHQTTGSFILIFSTMMPACAIFDYFWWKTIFENFDNLKNPYSLLGAGFGLNILGVFIGQFIGTFLSQTASQQLIGLIAMMIIVISSLIFTTMSRKIRTLVNNPQYVLDIRLAADATNTIGQRFDDLALLTKRESEIFDLLLSDVSYRQICDICNISINTVKTHTRNIYKKLHVESRIMLITKYGDKNTDHHQS